MAVYWRWVFCGWGQLNLTGTSIMKSAHLQVLDLFSKWSKSIASVIRYVSVFSCIYFSSSKQPLPDRIIYAGNFKQFNWDISQSFVNCYNRFYLPSLIAKCSCLRVPPAFYISLACMEMSCLQGRAKCMKWFLKCLMSSTTALPYVTEDVNGKYGWNQKAAAIIGDFQ